MSFSGSHTLGNPSGSPAEMAWPWVSTKPCIATMPSSLQSRYSPGATTDLPPARARIFSAMVIPIETSSGLSGSARDGQLHQRRCSGELLQVPDRLGYSHGSRLSQERFGGLHEF